MSSFSGVFSGNYVTAGTGIFWDVDDCLIPEELNAAETLRRLRERLTNGGHRGPVSIRAYGDMTGLDFQSSDIKLNHFSAGEKHGKRTKILEDIVSWSAENPDPSTLMLLSGDLGEEEHEFIQVIEFLKSQKNYIFILVNNPSPRRPPTRRRPLLRRHPLLLRYPLLLRRPLLRRRPPPRRRCPPTSNGGDSDRCSWWKLMGIGSLKFLG